jgi:hypothetical protein
MNARYQSTLERLYQLFCTCPDPNKQENPDGWSIKQVIGHLLDSLNNNHQRLARYQSNGNLAFPGYDQNVFVQRGCYAAFDFQALLALWYQYNLFFLHLITHLPEEELSTSTITVGERPTVTIAELIDDYFAHMENHERQVQRIMTA